jgi:hypothetical protein
MADQQTPPGFGRDWVEDLDGYLTAGGPPAVATAPPRDVRTGTVGRAPRPIDTEQVELPDGLLALIELLAEYAHDNWRRVDEGWRYGPALDDASLRHPLLMPDRELPEDEREYDRRLATETLKVLIKLGYQIRPDAPRDGPTP